MNNEEILRKDKGNPDWNSSPSMRKWILKLMDDAREDALKNNEDFRTEVRKIIKEDKERIAELEKEKIYWKKKAGYAALDCIDLIQDNKRLLKENKKFNLQIKQSPDSFNRMSKKFADELFSLHARAQADNIELSRLPGSKAKHKKYLDELYDIAERMKEESD